MRLQDCTLPYVALADVPTPLGCWINGPWGELWLKDDGFTSPVYGGNKVRKLELLFGQARARSLEGILTVGPAGSHHVLATTVHAERLGLRVRALLTPQPHSSHAQDNLRAALAHGLEALPLASASDALRILLRLKRPTDLIVGPGALGALGASAYAFALAELADQLQTMGARTPDAVFVAAGSGSTAAGLLAGVCISPLASTRIIAIQVSEVPGLRGAIIAQALAALNRLGQRASALELNRRLEVDRRWVEKGYGYATPSGNVATEIAAGHGLELEGTYTAKTLAAALQSVGGLPIRTAFAVRRYRHVVYWHTLSRRAARELVPPGAPVLGRLARLFQLS